MPRAIFLDRDGVLNDLILKEDGKLYSPHDLKDFKLLPGVADAVEKAKSLGFLIILITNQPDISRGFMTVQELEKMHDLLRREMPIDDVYVCLHDSHDQCACRKPRTEMLEKAAVKWRLDLSKSFLIGDRWKDIAVGYRSGVRTVLVSYYDEHDRASWANTEVRPDFLAQNLPEAVEIIERTIAHDNGG